MTYKAAIRKLAFEKFLMAPFVWLGKLAAVLFPLKEPYKVFLFFPNADIGGAPRVNADIATLVKNDKALIIFSKKAHNNLYRERYEQTGVKIIDLHRYIDNKLFHFVNFFFRGLLAGWINKQVNPVVFGGESIYFYKVISHLRKNIRCVELTHVDVWLPYTIAFADRLNARVFSTRQGMQQAEKQYLENKMNQQYFDRLVFIDNAVDIPAVADNKNKELQVFFIGRGAAQKRIHLVAAIAEELHNQHLPVQVSFVGDVDKIIDPAKYPYCSFYGSITSDEKMNELYTKADLLLLTSAFEGLPVVVMQMMAYGKVVISTAVSGIPDYIFHDSNGLLIFSTEETAIVREGVSLICKLLAKPSLKKELGEQARKDAMEKFGRQTFNRRYREILGI
jgi:glycosyltransferase involved in cell wall biosynthesis